MGSLHCTVTAATAVNRSSSIALGASALPACSTVCLLCSKPNSRPVGRLSKPAQGCPMTVTVTRFPKDEARGVWIVGSRLASAGFGTTGLVCARLTQECGIDITVPLYRSVLVVSGTNPGIRGDLHDDATAVSWVSLQPSAPWIACVSVSDFVVSNRPRTDGSSMPSRCGRGARRGSGMPHGLWLDPCRLVFQKAGLCLAAMYVKTVSQQPYRVV